MDWISDRSMDMDTSPRILLILTKALLKTQLLGQVFSMLPDDAVVTKVVENSEMDYVDGVDEDVVFVVVCSSAFKEVEQGMSCPRAVITLTRGENGRDYVTGLHWK